MKEGGREKLMTAFRDACYDQRYCEVKVFLTWFNTNCLNRLQYYAAGSKYDNYAEA